MLGSHRVFAYPFRDENRKQAAYWRDVGTLDAYFQTSMDLISIDPILNLYDREWPIHTYQPPMPPPKFVHTDHDRRGAAFNSIVCQGAIVSGGQVVSAGVRINSFSLVEDSISPPRDSSRIKGRQLLGYNRVDRARGLRTSRSSPSFVRRRRGLSLGRHATDWGSVARSSTRTSRSPLAPPGFEIGYNRGLVSTG